MVAMFPVARLGDTGTHGGAITTGSLDVFVNGLPVARVTDIYTCPIHGPNAIIQGSSRLTANGLQVARIGDPTACGATIASGSLNTDDGGSISV
jgi:uncharacterized Zn-binding protein involved in type VI secretion